MILERLQNFGGRGLNTPTPPHLGTPLVGYEYFSSRRLDMCANCDFYKALNKIGNKLQRNTVARSRKVCTSSTILTTYHFTQAEGFYGHLSVASNNKTYLGYHIK